MHQPQKTLAVANYFLHLARQHWPKKRINKIGMNHLVYYAHGWHLAVFNSPLIDEDVQAWEHGIRIPSLDAYYGWCELGNKPISTYAKGVNLGMDDLLTLDLAGSESTIKQAIETIEATWQMYKKRTCIQLSNSTHGEDMPWRMAMKNNTANKKRFVIPDRQIRQYFASQIEEPDRTGSKH